MNEAIECFPIEPLHLPWKRRLQRQLEDHASYLVREPTKRPPLERAHDLITETRELDSDDATYYGRYYLEAGELFREVWAWREAGGAYEQAFGCFKEDFYQGVDHDVLLGLIKSGLGFERALRQSGDDTHAMDVHAKLEQLTGLEFDIPIAVRMNHTD